MSWIDATELTPEILSALATARARWDAVRRSTARADRGATEEGIRDAYAATGLPPPRQIIWCGSPIELSQRRREHGIDSGPSVKATVVDAVVRGVGRAVELSTSRTFRSRLWSEARLSLPSPLSRGVLEAVNTATRNGERHRGSLWRRGFLQWLRRQPPPRRELPFEEATFSSHDGPPLAIYECLGEVCGLKAETAPVKGLLAVASSAGWIAPHEHVCWVSDRPEVLKADEQGRLHSTEGPALRFSDGWSYCSWKGVRIPSWMIEDKEMITVGLVNRERDPVLRRCMIDIMTPAKYIGASDAVCISRDDAGSLWVKTWQHWDSWAAVEVVNGSPEPDGSYRHYVLQVPPTMRTAREAVAWTYGLTEQEYARLRLRT